MLSTNEKTLKKELVLKLGQNAEITRQQVSQIAQSLRTIFYQPNLQDRVKIHIYIYILFKFKPYFN